MERKEGWKVAVGGKGREIKRKEDWEVAKGVEKKGEERMENFRKLDPGED